MPLSEIKCLLENRTPEITEDILIQQIGSLSKTQTNLAQAQLLLHTVLRSIQSGLKANVDTVSIQYLPAEQIILGEPNDYSGGRNAYDALFTFYQAMSIRYPLTEYDICYPVWGILSEERIRKGNWGYPRKKTDFFFVDVLQLLYGTDDD